MIHMHSGVTKNVSGSYLHGLTVDNVVLDLVLMVAGLTLRLVDSLALLGTLALTDQGSVAEPDGLIKGHLLVLDKAALLEVLITLLLLLWLEIRRVGGVASL